ncbi:MAG TPA: hypothetical protein VGG49_02480 [Steroidobacteraceae bacterium]|jgi:hypothetical protein
MAENPKVHSKGMTFHGRPHAPGKVEAPGREAPLPGHGAPASHDTHTEGAIRSVHYQVADLGHMERGEHATHPTHGKRK